MVERNDADLTDDKLRNENKDAPESTPAVDDSATISMQGVSGKVITGKVKVKKVRPAKAKSPDQKASDDKEPGSQELGQETKAKTPKSSSSVPMPRKISSGTKQAENQASKPVPKKIKSASEVKAEEKSLESKATTTKEEVAPKLVKKTVETPTTEAVKKVEPSKAEPAKIETPTPTPKKLGNIFDTPKPRKIKAGGTPSSEVEHKSEAKSDAKATTQAPATTSQESTKTTESPTTVESQKPEITTFKGPRKLGSLTNGPRKISPGVDDSLAATAKAFAKSKEEKKEREAKQKEERGGRTRFAGKRDNNTNTGGGSYNRGPNPRFNRNKSQDSFSPFDKDKDEGEVKFQSQPRRPKKKVEVVEDPKLARTQDGKNKFQRKDDKQTRSRDFSQPGQKRWEKGSNVYDDLREDRIRKRQKKQERKQNQPAVTHVSLPETLTVKEFAEAISRTSADVITSLIKNGIMATLNQEIDFETAAIIAEEFGVDTTFLPEVKIADILFDESEDEDEDAIPRPPVVSVMGHVDHGKTSLLDYIRTASVADGEAGGITQRIGAYMTEIHGKKITFLDTPGHEAFTTMRARGAQATDMVILVVAADDGVMPQTVEAINHAKAAGTEIIVAINKMDKAHANPDRVKQELAEHGLISEEWGGSTIMVPISAHTGQGIEDLLEMLLLSAEVLELKANPDRQAKGIIIEAQLDKHRGPVATLLVQRGTLRQGDTIVANSVVGNVRAMTSANGEENIPAGPSVPVEVLGLPDVPEAGTVFYVVKDEKMARQYAEERRDELHQARINRGPAVSLDNLFSQIEAGKLIDFNVVIKADVVGSVEAMTQSLEKLSNDEVRINIIHGGAGAINESDLRLAEASNATVIGFNVRANNAILDLAKDLGVDIKQYTVIYHAIEEVESAMKGLLKPVFEEVIVGHVEIRETFKVSSVGTIGGAYVLDGKIFRNSDIRLLRNDVIIHTGKLASLRRYENDVREVAAGYECGLSIQNFNDIEIGDVLEVFEMQEVERK